MPSVLWSVRYPAPKTWVLPAQCSSRKGLWQLLVWLSPRVNHTAT
jgi:hypothetical protein